MTSNEVFWSWEWRTFPTPFIQWERIWRKDDLCEVLRETSFGRRVEKWEWGEKFSIYLEICQTLLPLPSPPWVEFSWETRRAPMKKWLKKERKKTKKGGRMKEEREKSMTSGFHSTLSHPSSSWIRRFVNAQPRNSIMGILNSISVWSDRGHVVVNMKEMMNSQTVGFRMELPWSFFSPLAILRRTWLTSLRIRMWFLLLWLRIQIRTQMMKWFGEG